MAFALQDLNKLAALVRGQLSKLARNVLCALITIDVHARDMVTEMVASRVCYPLFYVYIVQLHYFSGLEYENIERNDLRIVTYI
jgi:dynein heavy chain